VGTDGHVFETIIQHLLQVAGHENRDKVSLGPGSARVGSRHGDSHFWVIRRHEFNGVVCFLI
jgi:hypothetical protein